MEGGTASTVRPICGFAASSRRLGGRGGVFVGPVNLTFYLACSPACLPAGTWTIRRLRRVMTFPEALDLTSPL